MLYSRIICVFYIFREQHLKCNITSVDIYVKRFKGIFCDNAVFNFPNKFTINVGRSYTNDIVAGKNILGFNMKFYIQLANVLL